MSYPMQPAAAPAPWPGGHPAQPTAVPAAMAPPGVVPAAGGMLAPPRRGPGVGTAIALVALGILVLVAIGVIGMQIGISALPVAAVLAFVPLALVLLAVRWVDRWEPEPWQALAVAFGWGASVSVLVALVLNTGAMMALVATGSSALQADIIGAAVVAPITEESIKALGVLIVFLVWRRSFDGPVDGLVYAATVAAGFAFVENILYFGSTMAATEGIPGGGSAVVSIFLMRGVMSPFAHLLFTACTGLALGIAAERRSRWAWLWLFPIGVFLAMVLHGLWNGSAMMGDGSGFLVMYGLFQVPLFLATVGLAFWLRRREARVLRQRLSEYAASWWFAPAEVVMLASLGERRRARTWAASRGGPEAKAAMAHFQRVATRLAYLRNRAQTNRADLRAAQDESAALNDLVAARHRLQRALAV
ncbi:PrsW family intramembrane metalloprotease [Actinotalea ferrariae]|uniref:PrsW family intramembrane metalloprotease n=1 Tax=Actinotalea ferrariae TaxID=1386098 RepID=UPI001C8B286A|nr:PrsW family intramembrane metalloprotease [Actinotalea ferrariae]MBX9246044.1 PrsW family intramembrane metalloprotease [Actinotalea ferrariae]